MGENFGFSRVIKRKILLFLTVAFLLILKIALIIVALIHHDIPFGPATC